MDDQVDKILGATAADGGGQLKFYIRLKGDKNPVLVSSDEAKQKYPYHVLEFYESCLVWESEDEEMDCDDDNAVAGTGDKEPNA